MVQFIIRVKCFISSYFYFCFYHYKIIILNIVVKRNKQLHVVHVSAIEVSRVWLLLLGNLRSNDAMATRTSLKKSIFSLLVLTRALTLSNVGEPNLRTISQFRRREPPFIGFERFIYACGQSVLQIYMYPFRYILNTMTRNKCHKFRSSRIFLLELQENF